MLRRLILFCALAAPSAAGAVPPGEQHRQTAARNERASAATAPADGFYPKHLRFPEDATPDEKVALAARLIPSPRQLAWQRRELTAFLHFGINTFTNREWGDGREDPQCFDPQEFDARQWIRTLRECGFEQVILTAKHHDGFCLWPTATTGHSVAASPWRDGRGDVVAEVSRACAEAGMPFGIYLSPWDRNAACYGDSERYNRFFIEQLTELLTGYGPISEVWFDGACGEGPDGRRQEYDWDAYLATIRRLQPEAVSAVMGEDVRWVGNERGVGRETEWSATVLTPGVYARSAANNAALGIFAQAPDLGSREQLAAARELFWYPSEVDVSIRPGWFWHEHENTRVKSLATLVDIYFSSVGRNSVLLLNVPPDTRGLLADADVTRLRELAGYLARTFRDDRVLGGERIRRADAGKKLRYRLKRNSRIDLVMLCERIEEGQRIEAFTVEARTSDGWREVAHGTTVGNKRLLRFAPVEASKLRIRIDGCRSTAALDRAAAFLSDELLPEEARRSDPRLLPREGRRTLLRAPLTLDLGRTCRLGGLIYAPAGGLATSGTAFRYRCSASEDGTTWREIAAGEFGNIMHNPQPQQLDFATPVEARYIRLDATTPDGEAARVTSEEVELLRCAE